MDNYEVVIGLEVHVQLSTVSKVFCGCSTAFGFPPNSLTCPVCLGFPGVLPVLNKGAFDRSIKVALALNCEIQEKIKFDRKNYYYPDLPKNYQISQYDMPFAIKGYLEISSNGKKRKIGITRVHLEEDAGKLIHDPSRKISYVDFNRAGTPLLEIVSEPEITSAAEASEYLKNLKAILLYLGVSDCNMEEGSLRCDANISVRKAGEKQLGTKIELKNMNSFKAVYLGLLFESAHLKQALKDGVEIIQATKQWDAKKLKTHTMRTKEEAHDYRYFPEPDLPPFDIDAKSVESIKKFLPELPRQRKQRIMSDYKLNDKDADVIIMDKRIADYFEQAVKLSGAAKAVANWLITELLAETNIRNTTIDKLKFEPRMLVELLGLIDSGRISGKMAKTLFRECIEKGCSPKKLVEESGIKQISDEKELDEIIIHVIEKNKKPVDDYKMGKANALMFLVGQVMKHTRGKAHPNFVNELLRKKLDKK